MNESLAPALVICFVLAFVGFVIWNRSRVNLERRRLELDAQARVLEKIGPGQALTDFLKTHEGKQLFDLSTGSASTSMGGRDARTRILALTTLGLMALGAGFFFIMAFAIPSLGARLMTFVPVFLLSGAGVGALIAAWLMHRLSKRWGMLQPNALDASAK